MVLLEPGYIEALLDVLTYPDGPRLRDHLSHGEVDTLHFPKYLGNHIFSIAIAFCLRFYPENISKVDHCSGKDNSLEMTYNSQNSQLPLLSKITNIIENYQSIFHPFSCFRREVATFIDNLFEWKNLTRPNEDEFWEPCSDDLFDNIAWKTIINTIFLQTSLSNSAVIFDGLTSREENLIFNEDVLKMTLTLLDNCKLKTLFRPRYELEVIAVLRQIVVHCLRTSDQVSFNISIHILVD